MTMLLPGDDPLVLYGPVLLSYLRIVTNPKVFNTPTPLDSALMFLADLRSASVSISIFSTPAVWKTFERLCSESSVFGNDVQDAFLAALAIEFDCELQTTDRGFSRFRGLKWRQPF